VNIYRTFRIPVFREIREVRCVRAKDLEEAIKIIKDRSKISEIDYELVESLNPGYKLLDEPPEE